ncbi:CotD family spore coat protein [Bacillus spongiae]|uniref:CotD family spore coat protein n=1 Tax=Bacillus spongiae TaxID=2683610 RepID=A0ABU8HDH4_9BACI
MFGRRRPVQVLPAVVHPTKYNVINTHCTYEVPHIHPTHTTICNHELFQHKHYCPHTQSVANEVSNQHFNCCGPGGPGGPGGPAPMPPNGMG